MIDVEGLKARINLSEVVGHYVPLQKRGREYVGRCVWHSPDNHPSMWVVPAKGFVTCFSCGQSGDAIAFVQHVEGCDFQKACELLGATDQWQPTIADVPHVEVPNRITSRPPDGVPTPDMSLRGLGAPSVTWAYHGSDGATIGYVARYETDAGKEIRCWTWGQRGDEPAAWACGHWSRPRPLYNLDRLTSRSTVPVIVVEGEKAADAASRLLPAYVVTTWPGGAKAWDRADWEPLRGRKVLLWPDADEPGVECMQRLSSILVDPAGLCCDVSLLDTNGMPDGWDAADWTEDTAALIAWARPRKRAIEPRTAPPAPAEEPPPEDTGDNPPAEPEPTAAPTRPVRRKPRLQVVSGAEAAVAVEDDPLPLELSESGIADEFAAANQADMRFVSAWRRGGWLVWTGQRWLREPSRNTAMQRVRSLAHGLKYRAVAAALQPGAKNRMESKNYCGAVLDFAEYDARLLAKPDQWDADPFLLGTPAGTVDLTTGDILAPVPEHWITRQTAVAPVAGPTPLFDSVIGQAADGDADVLAYLWRWLGYCLSGSTREEAFCFLWGPPGCGKTTLVEAVAAILGNAEEGGYAVKADMDWFIETRNDRGAGRMHPLHGARFAHAAETEEGRHWKPAMMKEATGGDTLVGERKYEERFSFRPSHKILIHGNHRPHMRQLDEGLRRRMQIVEYHAPVNEAERDVTLKTRLVAEYPAILFRMVQGCLEWQRLGLAPPAAVVQSREDYFDAEDSFGEWLAASTERRKGSRLSSSAAHRSYREWLTERGEHAPSSKRFSSLMQSRGYVLFKTGGLKFFRDVELTSSSLPPLPDDWR